VPQQFLGEAGAAQQLPPAAGAMQAQHVAFAPGTAPKPKKNKKKRAVPPVVPPMMQGPGYAAGVGQQQQVDFASGTPFAQCQSSVGQGQVPFGQGQQQPHQYGNVPLGQYQPHAHGLGSSQSSNLSSLCNLQSHLPWFLLTAQLWELWRGKGQLWLQLGIRLRQQPNRRRHGVGSVRTTRI
jgi:hypothetical protein